MKTGVWRVRKVPTNSRPRGRGVRAVRLQRHVGADRRADGREQAEAAPACASSRGRRSARCPRRAAASARSATRRSALPSASPHAPTMCTASSAAAPSGSFGRAHGPSPTRQRSATPSWPCDCSWSIMWSRKQMPVAISPRAPRSSTVHSAVASRAWTAWVLGPAAAGGGGTAACSRRASAGARPPPTPRSVLVRLRVPAPGVLLAARLLVARRPRPPRLPRRQPRRPRSSAVHCISMRRTQCVASRPSLVRERPLRLSAVFCPNELAIQC